MRKFEAYLVVTELEDSQKTHTSKVTQMLHHSHYGKKIDAVIDFDESPEALQDLITLQGMNCSSIRNELKTLAIELYQKHKKPIISYRLEENGDFDSLHSPNIPMFFMPGMYKIMYTERTIEYLF